MAKRRRSSKVQSLYKFSAEIIRWKEGDTTKLDPFFILVINNIALERPIDSKNFVSDMSTGSTAEKTLFTKIAKHIKMNIFGEMPDQAEKLFSCLASQ